MIITEEQLIPLTKEDICERILKEYDVKYKVTRKEIGTSLMGNYKKQGLINHLIDLNKQ